MLLSSPRPALAAGYVLAACGSIQVGSALAAELIDEVGSAGATALRLGLAAAGLFVLGRPKVRTWSPDQWRSALALGVCLVGMNGSFYLALARIPLGSAVTLEFLGPLTLSALTSPRRRDLIWVGWALAGVLLLGAGHNDGQALDPLGVALALVAGMFWALYVLAAARVGQLTSGLEGLAVATGAAALLAAPLGVGGAWAVFSSARLAALAVATAVLASLVPYSLELGAVRSLSPRLFSILLSLEPAVAAAVGWLLLGEGLSAPAALGIALVVAASVGAARGQTKRLETESP